MAKDKVDISIPASIDVIRYDINKWNIRRENIKNNNINSNQNISRNDYWINKDNYYIKYFNDNRFAGRLIISCNINKMLQRNHINKVKNDIDLYRIKDILENELEDIIDFSSLTDIKEWGISREETFIDVLMPTYISDALFKVLIRTKCSRKKIDTRYSDNGTIYYYSGEERKNSKCLYKIYDKGLESASRGKPINIQSGMSIIRFESKSGRSKIRRIIKSIREKLINQVNNSDKIFSLINTLRYCYSREDLNLFINNDHMTQLNILCIVELPVIRYNCYDFRAKYKLNHIDSVYIKNLSKNATFNDTCDNRYEKKSLIDFVKDIGMDKEKLTRSDLFKRINDIFETPKTRKTAKEVIEFLNGERINPPINKRSMVAYQKKILDAGIYHIYSDVYIPAIDISYLSMSIDNNESLINLVNR